jgi:DNA polymerase-3 subunit delta'
VILGHHAIRERLRAAADRDGLHHAYLFEGPRGIGRRKVADWLALYVNCLDREHAPCGRCARCTTIQAGSHPDVIALEPDPERASGTITVDEVRELIRKSGYHRFDSERRVLIVDPADAMLEPAANALLKTLEEPPDGTGFILITTSARRLLPTIVSRCQLVRFGAVPTGEIAAWLTDRGVEDAELCARLSLGSPGRALELADGGLEARRAARSVLVRLGQSGTLKGVFDHNQKLTKGTARVKWMPDALLLFEVLEELLRDVAVYASGAEGQLLHADEPELVADWARRLWPGGVEQIQRALLEARDQFEVNVNGRLVLDQVFTTVRAQLGA